MAIRKLGKAEWQRYFDRISKAVIGKRAEIEIASLALGDQIEAEWLPLIGIAYDRKDDILEIALVISKEYGIQLKADSKENHVIFGSLNALSKFVAAQRKK